MKPETKLRAGPISLAIWNNEVKTKDGETRSFKTISLERSYKDKNDAWQKTSNLRIMDLPKAVLLLNKAFEKLSLTNETTAEEDTPIPEEAIKNE